jgi:hypothetical protein
MEDGREGKLKGLQVQPLLQHYRLQYRTEGEQGTPTFVLPSPSSIPEVRGGGFSGLILHPYYPYDL